MASTSLNDVNKYIDNHMGNFKDGLKDAVAIKSVSSSHDDRESVVDMINTVAKRMEEKLKMVVEKRPLGPDPVFPDIQLPPVILATLGNDSQKKTLCIYGHLDVQPAEVSDGWDTKPFVMEIKGDEMFGRGTSDDKGPVLGWLNVIEAFQQTKTEIPMNLKFVFEGMEESGSTGLDELIEAEKEGFFKDVDYISISDNYWLGTKKPCLTYGLRGIVYFHANVNCATKDLHSGVHGGPVYEAMADLVALLGSLTDVKGNILVPKVSDKVVDLTEEEKKLYKNLDFSMETYRNEVGAHGLTTEDDMNTLMRRWRYPSLSIHGVEGAFYGPGDKTVIPSQVTGKFSIRLVPNQDPAEIGKLVIAYLDEIHKKRGSPNHLKVTYSTGAAKSWLGSFESDIYEAGKKATLEVHGVEPDYTREGGSIPVVLTLANTTGKDVLLLPMGRSDDGAHSQNEKLNITNFQKGMKLFAAYLKELAGMSSKKQKK